MHTKGKAGGIHSDPRGQDVTSVQSRSRMKVRRVDDIIARVGVIVWHEMCLFDEEMVMMKST
jgi:hypothetical protein